MLSATVKMKTNTDDRFFMIKGAVVSGSRKRSCSLDGGWGTKLPFLPLGTAKMLKLDN
jgi:hypothetical protein